MPLCYECRIGTTVDGISHATTWTMQNGQDMWLKEWKSQYQNCHATSQLLNQLLVAQLANMKYNPIDKNAETFNLSMIIDNSKWSNIN